MIIAMAGLPATGKSTLARQLAEHEKAFRLDKDEVRVALFRSKVDYSAEQNDLCVKVMFETAAYLLRHGERMVILDGRTFSRRSQLEELQDFAEQLAVPLAIVECQCSDESAKRRLAQSQGHLAEDRNADLYDQLKARAESIPEPKLLLDTDMYSVPDCLQAMLDYIAKDPAEKS